MFNFVLFSFVCSVSFLCVCVCVWFVCLFLCGRVRRGWGTSSSTSTSLERILSNLSQKLTSGFAVIVTQRAVTQGNLLRFDHDFEA